MNSDLVANKLSVCCKEGEEEEDEAEEKCWKKAEAETNSDLITSVDIYLQGAAEREEEANRGGRMSSEER